MIAMKGRKAKWKTRNVFRIILNDNMMFKRWAYDINQVKQQNKNVKGNIHKRLKVYAQEEARRNLEKRQIRIRHILAKDQTQKKLSSNVCFKKLMNRNAGTRAFYKSILNGGDGQNQDRQSLKWPKTSLTQKWHDEDSRVGCMCPTSFAHFIPFGLRR